AADYRKHFPDGRIGSEPHRATPEHGKRFYEAGLADALDDYRGFTAQR
ncbi:MAG: creatininase family protein, partial [Gammaproteobacteria bacterium]|nr:creatininase family protein [Gammaproteobacteria bacterium]